jgi:hypothetical protein
MKRRRAAQYDKVNDSYSTWTCLSNSENNNNEILIIITMIMMITLFIIVRVIVTTIVTRGVTLTCAPATMYLTSKSASTTTSFLRTLLKGEMVTDLIISLTAVTLPIMFLSSPPTTCTTSPTTKESTELFDSSSPYHENETVRCDEMGEDKVTCDKIGCNVIR